MRRALLVLAVAGVLPLANASAGTTVAIGSNLEQMLDQPLSEATADNGSTIERGTLDTSIVIEIVRERLQDAALRVATRAIKKLLGDDLHPWMRDLFQDVIHVATDRDRSVRVAAEGVLRIGARMVIAEAVVRTRMSDKDDATRRTYIDWLYWRLAHEEPFTDTVERPSCAKDDAACAALAKETDDDKVIAKIDADTGMTLIITAIDMVRRLHKDLAGKTLSLTDLIDDIMSVGAEVSPAKLGFDQGAIQTFLGGADALAASYEAIRARAKSLAGEADSLGRAMTAYVGAVDDAKLAEVRASLRRIDQLLTSPLPGGKGLLDSIDAAAATVPGLSRLFAPLLEPLKAIAAIKPDDAATSLVAALTKAWPADLAARMAALDLPELSSRVERVRTALTSIANTMGSVTSLSNLTVDKVQDVITDFSTISGALDAVADVADQLQLGAAQTLRDAAIGARKVSNWCQLIVNMVSGSVSSGTLGKIVDALGALRGKDGDMPLVSLLLPVLDQIGDSSKLELRHFIAAFAKLDVKQLYAAFGLPTDIGAECKHGGSTCWGMRLVLLTHDAISYDGTEVQVHTEDMVDDLATIAGSPEDRNFSPYLHLSVGTGILWRGLKRLDTPKPLIAEQIGVGMKLCGGPDVALRVAAYGSGLLYRLFLDSEESKGVMFGGAAMIDLFGDVEVFASVDLLVIPPEMKGDKTADMVGTIGVQVPLADYLRKLKK